MFSKKIQDLLDKVRQEEGPHVEPCYNSCSAATSPKALENLGFIIQRVGVMPTEAISTRNGTIEAIWMTTDSFYDGKGHFLGGQEFIFDIGPDEQGIERHQALLVKQGTIEARDSEYLWKSSNWYEILNKLTEFCFQNKIR